MLKSCIEDVIEGHHLTENRAAEAMGIIMDGGASPIHIAALLVALRQKGESVEEISGAATAMRSRMNRVVSTRTPLLDTCGTGGTGLHTFNISTCVAFVAAAGGIAVAKHGNRAVSSKSGSADVLAALGVNIEAPMDVVMDCVDNLGIGFMFAPSHHPAMRYAAPVRKELGIRTLFNLLGPLTNPAGAQYQLLGVFDRRWVEPMAQVLGKLGSQRAWVVHGADGLDELSMCAVSYVAEWNGTTTVMHTIDPEDLGLKKCAPEALKGGSAKENAIVFREILSGQYKGPLRDAVVLNAAAAFVVTGFCDTLKMGIEKANHILDSAKALRLLDALIQASAA